MAVEVELKLIADGPRALDRLAEADRLGPARLGPADTVDELDRYLDTPDGRFATARWACRLRTRGARTIVSLKGPADAVGEDGLHRRPEVEGTATIEPDPESWPASAARDLVDELRAGQPLVERLALAQRRTERAVLLDGGRIGTLSLDRVGVLQHDIALGERCFVELELVPGGSEAALPGLASALAAIDGLAPDPRTKLEHALSLVDRRKAR